MILFPVDDNRSDFWWCRSPSETESDVPARQT
jgi:hypothetical protein